jgi:hypothetical protein
MVPIVVSTTDTHYRCGSFIKEVVVMPNFYVGTNPNAHVQLFKKVIQANGEKRDVDIRNLFSFTL